MLNRRLGTYANSNGSTLEVVHLVTPVNTFESMS
jgi:hypothetical protein